MARSTDVNEELRQLERELEGEDVRDAACALLEPDEVLRELGEVNVAYGDDGPVQDWRPVEVKPSPRFDRVWSFCTKTWPRKIVFFTLLAPMAVYLAIDCMGPTLIDRMVGGRICHGPPDSLARRVQHALSVLGGGANHYMATDRRLLMARGEVFARPPVFTPVMSVPLRQIALARRRRRGLLRRRVELRFADGSRIVLALPPFATRGLNGGPKRLVTALHPGTTH